MRLLTCILILGFQYQAGASDSWICKEEASQRRGDTVLSCGIGQGIDENAARVQAFDNAKIEFDKVCKLSSDCKGKQIVVVPKRNSCEQIGDSFKCYRSVEFNIVEATSFIAPFVYANTPKYSRVEKGMQKAQVLALFGAPLSVYEGNFQYEADFCLPAYQRSFCHVHFDKSGRVVSTSDFKPIYTDDLK